MRETKDMLEICRRLWQYEGGPGLVAMQMLKDNVSTVEFTTQGQWFYKTNLGRGNQWIVEAGRSPHPADAIFHYSPEMDYPFRFKDVKTIDELVVGFRECAAKGLVRVEMTSSMGNLAEKNYFMVGHLMGALKLLKQERHRKVAEKEALKLHKVA